MSFSWVHGRLLMIVVLSVLSLLVSGPTAARTWYVKADSTGDAPTIYEAVDSASYGDTVLVAPGNYYRERDKPSEMGVQVWLWLKDGVTITSEEGPEVTVLWDTVTQIANDTVYGYEVTAVTFSGFTIYSGFGMSAASGMHVGAIFVEGSDTVIENNVIRGYFEFGIDARWRSPHDGTPVIRNNDIRDCGYGIMALFVERLDTPLIEGNTVKDCEYGMQIGDSDPYIVGNIVAGNTESGILFVGWSQSLMHSNRIIGNGKYGVEDRTDYIYQSPCLNCTFTKETANDVYGNGLYDVYFVEETGLGRFEATYNYWGNLCPQPSQFYGRVGVEVWVDSTHTVVCTDCDSCHHSTETTTWGAIKALFR